MLFVGIDPGVENGVAVWSSSSECFLSIETLSFWQTIRFIHDHSEWKVILEDPNFNKPTFNRGFKGKINDKISQNVGSNKRTAQLIREYLELNNIPFELVVPKTSKLSVEAFQNLTKYTKRTSQHGRDAAKLVFKR